MAMQLLVRLAQIAVFIGVAGTYVNINNNWGTEQMPHSALQGAYVIGSILGMYAAWMVTVLPLKLKLWLRRQ